MHHGGAVDWVTNGALASRVIFALAQDPVSASILWAGTDSGLYRSTDRGVSWTPVTSGLTATGIYALLFDPASASTFYAGTDAGVFKSTDGGANWSSMNQGLTNLTVNALALGSGENGAFYAGTFGGGVFHFTNELEAPFGHLPRASSCSAPPRSIPSVRTGTQG